MQRPSEEYWEPDRFMDLDDFEDEPTVIEVSASSKKKSPNVQKSSSNIEKKKNQASLLDAGFSRRRSDSPSNGTSNKNKNPRFKKNSSFDCHRTKQQKLTTFQRHSSFTDPDSTTPLCQEIEEISVPTSSHTSLVGSTVINSAIPAPSTGDLMVFVDVSIEGQVFRIPIMLSQVQTNTIGWLAEQASHKYAR